MPWYFDESLKDLEGISAEVNVTRLDASETRPMVATITIAPTLMFNILTRASLYGFDNPFVPKPEVGQHAEQIQENNQAEQAYEWEMSDTIRFLEGALSKACDPQYGNDRKSSISLDRKIRKMKAEGPKETPKTEPKTPEDLNSEWEATNVKPLSSRDTVGLMAALLEDPDRPVSNDIVMQLFEAYRQEAAKVAKLEKAARAAREALGGF